MDHAVLTGDLVASRRHGEEATDAALSHLNRAALAFGARWNLDPRFTRFRGDGWQILLDRPPLLLDALLSLLARLRGSDLGIDTRIAIGLGGVTDRGSSDLADAAGEAFNRSGGALDDMGSRRLIAIAGARSPGEAAIVPLVDLVTQSWTAPQAEALALSLENPTWTQADIASTLGITRQAVQLRLAGAGTAYLLAARDALAAGEGRA